MRGLRVFAAVSACALAIFAGATVTVYRTALPPDGPALGVRLEGVPLLPGDLRAQVENEATRLESRVVTLELPGDAERAAPLRELGVRVDREAAVRRVLAVGRDGTLAVRLRDLLSARRGAIDVPLTVSVDGDVVAGVLGPLKEDFDEHAKAARFDVHTGTVSGERPGQYLDVDGSVEAIRSAALGGARRIPLPRVPIAPEVSAESLRGFSPSRLVASYETWFARHGKEASRAKNIEVAASRLDGLVLAPGQIVSFNAVVGPRRLEHGFFESGEIFKGEMVTGVGGGTCQVSSTLHAASLYAGLDVVERSPHSRPLGYIGIGLDSTVVYPEVDLKLRNPWPFPLVVHTQVDGGRLRVELYSEHEPPKVRVHTETLKVRPFKRKVTVKHYLPPGKFIKKEKGIRGYDVRRTRYVALPEGSHRVEVVVDRYPPTPEHFWVSPELDLENDLPELPEGAEIPEPAPAASREMARESGGA